MSAYQHHPAMSLVGTPYKRGGTTPREGFDCFTLMAYVRRNWFQRETPTGAIPADTMPSLRAAALGIFRALGGEEKSPSLYRPCEPVEGCAVGLAHSRLGRLAHCGVLVGGGVLHAVDKFGVIWQPLDRVRETFGRVEFFECQN